MQPTEAAARAEALVKSIETVIVGKTGTVRLTVCTLLANGHVLLEDVPGTGKTMLAKALAKSISVPFGRVQFTPDLLPAELVGINFYSPQSGEFTFRPGSLFCSVLLADEINRATPRTQSGLLESMEERQVTVDGVTHALPRPYFVIATQNPVETGGTFPLPEAQLDRFLVRLALGYPTHADSVAIVRRQIEAEPLEEIAPVCTGDELLEMQAAARGVYIHPEVYTYAVSLAEATRENAEVALGVSTRGALALCRLAQAHALLAGRGFVTPDDVRLLAPYVFCHRLVLHAGGGAGAAARVVEAAVNATEVPVEDWERA